MGFDREYVLAVIEDTGDGEYASTDRFLKEEMPEDAPQELKDLVEQNGTVVGIDYVDLGEDGHDAYGLFSFLPEDPGDPCAHLAMVITLTNRLSPAGMTALYQLLNRINLHIPEGAYIISEDETTLVYRNDIQIPKELDNDGASKVVAVRLIRTIALVTEWIDGLMGYNDGTYSLEECMERTKMTSEV